MVSKSIVPPLGMGVFLFAFANCDGSARRPPATRRHADATTGAGPARTVNEWALPSRACRRNLAPPSHSQPSGGTS